VTLTEKEELIKKRNKKEEECKASQGERKGGRGAQTGDHSPSSCSARRRWHSSSGTWKASDRFLRPQPDPSQKHSHFSSHLHSHSPRRIRLQSLHLSLPSLRLGPSPQTKKGSSNNNNSPPPPWHPVSLFSFFFFFLLLGESSLVMLELHHHHHLHHQQQRHHHPALLQLASVSLSQSAWGPEIRSLFRGLVCTCWLPVAWWWD
jgi:hypothetical protein